MKPYGLYILDLDGVLYRGSHPIPGAAEAVARLRSKAKVRFLTNNSTQTRTEFAEKLSGMGIPAERDEVYTSAAGAGMLLKGASAYVVGENGLRSELAEACCNVVEIESAEWVVVGACWSLTYSMIDEAQWRIRQGARYLATNPDTTFPIESGRLMPGAGAVVAAVSAAAGKEPEIIVGKPQPTLVQLILEEAGTTRERVILIGDREDTDIACAKNAGVASVLVLTGVAQKRDKTEADYVLESVALL